MQLPIFPANVKILSPNRGVFEHDGTVFYLYNGSPVFLHAKDDLNKYL